MTDLWSSPRDAGEDVPPPDWMPAPPGVKAFWLAVGLVGALVAARVWVAPHITQQGVQAWSTVFVAICVQALPFLVFGVLISAAITVLVPAQFWVLLMSWRASVSVPIAGAAGAVLPGCECASVPVAGGLMARGVAPAAALTFLLAAPAINPVVMVATAVAVPNQPAMVSARFTASLLVSVLAGWCWLYFGKGEWLRIPARPVATGGRWGALRSAVRHDFLQAGGFLVLGGAAAATMNVAVPPTWIGHLAGNGLVSVLVLAVLAVLMSICSEADAFVASSLTQFSPTAKLAFLVVGPMVDLKLIALQTGTFGRRFAVRFVPLTFVLAVTISALLGRVFF